MPTPETVAVGKESSLQEKLGRIESLITEAHVRVSTMAPSDDGKEPQEANDRAIPTAARCVNRLEELVERLTALAERIGYV